MNHDPLCPCFEDCEPNDVLNAGDDPQHEFMSQYGNECIQCLEECHCEIIAKARADEREQIIERLDTVVIFLHERHCEFLDDGRCNCKIGRAVRGEQS